jgi:5,10-methylenetetrahydrofolate reductase
MFALQARALEQGGVDLFSVETFYDMTEIEAAVQGIRSVSSLPIAAQITLDDDGTSLEGASPELFGPQLAALDVNVIGVNCSVGPAAMLPAVEKLVLSTHLPVMAQPNAGKPRVVENRNLYLCSPEYMATYAARFIAAGARVVGGCCGTTPDHLAAIRRAVRAAVPVKVQPSVAAVEIIQDKSGQAIKPIPLHERSRFAARVATGRFPISVEMLPPRGHDLKKCFQGARLLNDAGIDAINIPDGPRASARMSPMAMAIQLEQNIGIETIIHYCCRDRNLLGMQSDLLGAHALGLRNVLLVTGDPPKLGDYPDATAVFDVDSIGLSNMVNRLNHGADVGGNPIGKPTSYCFGVGVNPGMPDLDHEISRLQWKVEAGAEFVITQPVFDVQQFLAFRERILHIEVPVLAGIWPLASYRNAEFMNNEVPGIHVPQEIMERMRATETRVAARKEGIAIACEMLQELLPHIQGAQIAAPFGRYKTAIEVASAVPEAMRPTDAIS